MPACEGEAGIHVYVRWGQVNWLGMGACMYMRGRGGGSWGGEALGPARIREGGAGEWMGCEGVGACMYT